MAALTPTSTQVISMGNVIGILGTFAAISDADTWAPGLVTVMGATVTNGANDVDTGATYSGGTVIVQSAGALANAKVLAIGT